MKTKKVGASGKFGSRYGKKVRVNFLKVASKNSNSWKCPSCMKDAVARKSAGIWECSKCGYKFAGKAYKPS